MQITATLTRLHKIEERLKAKRYELQGQTTRLLSNRQVVLTRGLTVTPVDNKANTEKAIDLFNQIHKISGVIHSIRAVLGKKNAELGIYQILAELDQQKYVRAIVAQHKSGAMNYLSRKETIGYDSEEIQNIINRMNQEPTGETSEPLTMTVKGVHTSYEEDLNKIVEQYDVRINALTDSVSDLNKEKITLEIPDEYAGVAGVSAK